MNSRHDLVRVLEACLTPAGFHKTKTSWYSRKPELTWVVNLQKSDFGGQYYLNLGVSFLALDDALQPAIKDCQIFTRLRYKSPSGVDIAGILDLEDISLPADERVRLLTVAINDGALRFFQRCESVSSIADGLRIGFFKEAGVRTTVYELCGVPQG